MTYAMIAPLILGFSTIGFCFIYLVYKYNLLYIYDSEIDTKGLAYPYALSHLLVGMYFSEICLIGLFALQYAVGPTVLMIALLIFTALLHMSLLDAIGPLLVNLPVTLAPETQREPIDNNIEDEQWDPFIEEDEEEPDTTPDPGPTRNIEGLPAGLKAVTSGIKSLLKTKLASEAKDAGITLPTRKPWTGWLSPVLNPTKPPNLLLKWLHPEIYADSSIFAQSAPPASSLPDPLYPTEIERFLYHPPVLWSDAPFLWVPRDSGGVSAQEIKHSGVVVRISDENGVLEEDGGMRMDFGATKYLGRGGRWGRY